MSHNYIRTSWNGFPKIQVLYPLNTLKKASDELYHQAKSGDVLSAFNLLATTLDTYDKIINSSEFLTQNNPIIVPVLAIEALGKNRIPAVFAEMIGEVLDLRVSSDIVQTVKANHTNAGAYERIVRQPRFDGCVEQGANYIIVDDTVAMGGTLAALKGYIESKGGNILRAVTLTGLTVPEFDIVPTEKMLRLVTTKHPELPEWWKNEFGFPIEYLTQGELGHLRTPSTLDEIRNRLITSGFQSSNESGENIYKK
ncbi:phosphoribosyltransferase [Acinetobacter colistiniresistens]|uniref:phosphoribosyltransferase n=1 Tax=Acinetobacter colistiniresistens TaxID=280145 RepID=UPI002FDFCE64